MMAAFVIDCRSDTVTKPSKQMREAMMECEVGDDVFGDDETVLHLQSKLATMFGKENAVFVPSGTMANLIAVSVHCETRGSEYICGSASHITLYEQGSGATIGGAHPRQIQNEIDGTMKIEAILDAIRVDDDHMPTTRLVCLEQTHNNCGGRVLLQSYVDEVCDRVKEATSGEVKIHMDGARIWNACVKNEVSLIDAARKCDSVSVCLSKAVGAPVGSVILGTKEFVRKCKRLRKALGGGMRQVGVLAAAAEVGVDKWEQNVTKSNLLAALFAKGMKSIDKVTVGSVESNLVIVSFQNLKKGVSIHDVVEWLKKKYGVLVTVFGAPYPYSKPNSVRVCFHYQISEDEVEFVISALKVASWDNCEYST